MGDAVTDIHYHPCNAKTCEWYGMAAGPSWAQVEAWLKARRDEYTPRVARWHALDDALDDLREHMHTGTPLGQPVQRTQEDTR
jgi:hypothetical protein